VVVMVAAWLLDELGFSSFFDACKVSTQENEK
jgi:hypothetical protein